MCILTDGSEKPIPEPAVVISDNTISTVWASSDGWIYKRSIPFLIENEEWCLREMSARGFAPRYERFDKYTLRIADLGESEPITNPKAFRITCKNLLAVLKSVGIRHGDLTRYAIVVKNNWPFLIDFAESRLIDDPRPDKRPEGDEYWLNKTVRELIKESKDDVRTS